MPLSGFNTRLSSAGLVYKHFGKEVIARELGKPEDDAVVHTVWLKVRAGHAGGGSAVLFCDAPPHSPSLFRCTSPSWRLLTASTTA